MLGVVLPILPTTPFLLIALWAASKSSPQLENWLLNHKRYGLLLVAWRERQAIPKSAKWLACSMMAISWLILWQAQRSWTVLMVCGLIFVLVAIYILSRPSS
jgi:uncharacterized membrane protein YbaN (DUF454 family)